jgi:hypothetical protein
MEARMAEPATLAHWISELKRITATIDIQAGGPVKSGAVLCAMGKALRAVVKEMEGQLPDAT